ncbi:MULTISPECIES: hypothetical protein [unclassified Clostridium]|uniref:hypothetical protein n=1 Tax=unclassified Clostridium TaxID=2614128 RepID=UPI0002974016|nr:MULTISPECIES: hypothetical protein [unclassified Clostridium]EKQ50991.1 MAG: hypothetical protein A370_05273 [Clostridium sp. Maddingley MBC34-26]
MIKAVMKSVNKEEILDEFLKKYVGDRWIDEFNYIDEKYKNNKDLIQEDLKSKFSSVCKLVKSLQEQGTKGEIKHIYFSLLRTSLLENKGEFRIDFYDERWFLDKVDCSVNINLDFIYTSLFKHMEELKEKRKEYGRTITDMDIEEIMLLESNLYHILSVEFLRNFIDALLELPSYKEMKKSTDIKVMVGEFMDVSDLIYPKEEVINS